MNNVLKWLLNLTSSDLAGGDWRVGFAAEYGNYARLALLVLGAGLVWLIVHTYRREGPARLRLKGALAAIRILVVVLVLAIFFQPAVIVRTEEILHSSIVLLLDDSLSMSFNDRYANGQAAETRDGLARALNAPQDKITSWSRREILQRLLTQESVLSDLNRDHPIELVSFSTDRPGRQPYTQVIGTIPLNSFSPNDLRDALAKLRSAGHETNFSAAIRDVLDRYQGRRLGALVVLSDGQPTDAGASERLAAALEHADQRGLARLSVLVGDPAPPRNLSVVALRAPREVRANAKMTFTVLLSQRNLAGHSAEVRLYRRKAGEDWPADLLAREPLERAVVTLESQPSGGRNEGTQTVQIEHTPPSEELGEYVYRAVAAPQAEERTTADNAAEAFVKVSDEKIRILLVSADAGWEFQYLRNYFLRQGELYRLSVWQQDADPELNQSASTGMKLSRLPRTLREMIDTGAAPTSAPGGDIPPGYHVVILYDPSPTKNGFDKTFIDNLYEFVTAHRGGLCYIASNRNTADVLRDPAAKKLADLLPVVVGRNEADVTQIIQETRPQPWCVRLTSYGSDHPVTKLESTAEENRKTWSVLPGIFRAQDVIRTKPAARVLAEHSDSSRKTRLKGDPLPLIAVHTVGNGRVLYLGFDETWRWRFLDDGFYHRRFWGNVVRYLAPLHARQVIITAGGDQFDAGQKITVEVEAYDRDFRPLSAKTFPLRIVDVRTGKSTVQRLPAQDGKSGCYRATIVPPHVGTYELTCDAGVADASRVASKQIVVRPPQAEARRTEADAHTLRTIASRKDYSLRADEIGKLAKLIPPGRLTAVEERRHTLWDTKLMWMVLIALLAVEWFLRKRANMA